MRTFFLVIGAWAVCGTNATGQVVVYSNNTTNEGIHLNSTPATINGNTITGLVADDITVAPSGIGMVVSQFQFGIRNSNTFDAVTVRPRVRFYLPDGANGGPGTFIQGYDVPNVALAANSLAMVNFTPTTGFIIPSPGASGTNFWAGLAFDDNNGTTGITFNQLQNIGWQYFDPPTVGSSLDHYFSSSTQGDFASNNPPGNLFNGFPGLFVANFLWQFTATPVPEPTSLALFGIASAVAVSWRRMRKVNRTDRA